MTKRGTRYLVAFAALAMLMGSAEIATAAKIQVQVNSNFFSPSEVFIATGDTIVWVWNGGPHDTISDALGSDGNPLWSSPVMGPGSMFEYKFTSAGDYTYKCSIHFSCCNMQGIVHVVDQVKLKGILSASSVDPGARGRGTFEMRPYRAKLHVRARAVTSTSSVDVFVNGNFVANLPLDANGNGDLKLNTEHGDAVPELQDGDEIEVYDAADDATLIFIGNVHTR